MKTEGCHYLLRKSRGHGGPEGPMDHMEGHGRDKEPSHIEGPGVPKGTHLEEETGSALIQGVEYRTSPRVQLV